jgi:hypothetical protein
MNGRPVGDLPLGARSTRAVLKRQWTGGEPD